MGGLDINLIKEYAKCPGLYDRNSAYYKDRMYIQEKWSEISQKLGFEVRLLKERMLQLRNRYNLEKRRIDTLKSKYPSRIVRSQWPLYKHMDFMNGHIKHRRSFSKMTPRLYRQMSVEGDVGSQSPLPMTKIHNSAATSSSGISTQKSINNGEVDIKFENTFDFDEDPPSVINADNDNFMDDDSELKDTNVLRPQVTLNPPELLNDEPCLYEKVSLQTQQQQLQQQKQQESPIIDAKEKLRLTRLKKYEAFGKFLAMSLCDMPEIRAMKMIEKITSDLVVSYLNVDDASASPATTINSTTSTTTTTSVTSQQQQQQQQQSSSQQQQQQNQIIQTIPKQTQSEQNIIKKIEERSNLSGTTEIPEEQVLCTTTNESLNTLVDGEEYEDQDEDQFVYDLTEDEPLSA